MPTPHPPLLPGGFQHIGPWQLDQQFLEPFSTAAGKRRKRLMTRFRRFLEDLAKLDLPLELWIGGSFATLNPEPDAVDVVVWAGEAETERLPPKRMRLFERLLHASQAEWVKANYEVDVSLADPDSPADREYWTKKFSADPANLHQQGIFKLLINHA